MDGSAANNVGNQGFGLIVSPPDTDGRHVAPIPNPRRETGQRKEQPCPQRTSSEPRPSRSSSPNWPPAALDAEATDSDHMTPLFVTSPLLGAAIGFTYTVSTAVHC